MREHEFEKSKTSISMKVTQISEVCPQCYGSGKFKIIQGPTFFRGTSIRISDTSVKCDKCKGSGRK